ncbi:MAG: S-layer homology domain-containing protein [Microcystaceae cyanobacterium]
MLPKLYSSFRLSILACLLGLVTACSGNNSLEGRFAADPNLKNSPGTMDSPSPSATPSNGTTQATLPDDFPQDIPRYPTAQLLNVESLNQQVLTRWTTPDPSNLVEDFYLKTFQSNNWEISQPFSPEAGNTDNTLIARRDELEVKVSMLPSSGTTEFIIEYPTQNSLVQSTPIPTTSPQASIITDSPLTFSDLDRVPESLRQYVEDLANLGVLTASSNTSQTQFNPNATITRRDYARWLVAANNKLFASVPGKQIRLGSDTSQPAFQDVSKTDPDFAVIQGLAETGIIPSQLSGDSTALLFRPDAPLTREDLIAWTVPLDNRKALPTATLDGVKSTWGFQDAAKIDPKAWRSLYADFQNGDQANVRRVFGYTTLLQPKKTVTRAEAAAALWYFGFQGDGISAQEALQSQNQPQPQPQSQETPSQ